MGAMVGKTTQLALIEAATAHLPQFLYCTMTNSFQLNHINRGRDVLPRFFSLAALAIYLCLAYNSATAQNLVPNPSFEEITRCPDGSDITRGPLYLAPPWYNLVCSPDLFNTCSSDFFYTIPQNVFGYQYPRTGSGYAGIYAIGFGSAGDREGAREYLACPLSTPLSTDSFYRVSFFANRAAMVSDMACNRLGAVFSEAPFPPPPGYDCITSVQRDIVPNIILEGSSIISLQDSVISDTLNWIEICGIYHANGTERHLSIGVFNTVDQIDTVRQPLVFYRDASAYYYIDDVSVEKIPAFLADPIADTLVYQCSAGEPVRLALRAGAAPLLWSTGVEAASIEVSAPGWYYVEGPDTGCGSRRDSVRVAPPGAVQLDAGPDTLALCPGQLPRPHTALSWGVGFLSWNNGDTGPLTTLDAPGAYILSLAYTCGVIHDTLLLQRIDPPVPDLGPDTAICRSQFSPWTLNAPPGYDTYVWQGSQPSGPLWPVQDQGLYVLSAGYACGLRTDSLLLTFLDPPPLNLPADTLLCPGAELYLSAPPGYELYQWSDGASGPQRRLNAPGQYLLVAQHLCRIDSAFVDLQYAPLPNLQLPEGLSPPLGEPIILRPDTAGFGHAAWLWLPSDFLSCDNCLNPTANPPTEITYTLVGVSQWGCRDSASLRISPNDELPWYAPNAFSPNDDGINDRLSLHLGPAAQTVLAWEVYDRWGGQRWQARDLPAAQTLYGWDGRQNNIPAPTGAYAWRAAIMLRNGDIRELAGEVMLLR